MSDEVNVSKEEFNRAALAMFGEVERRTAGVLATIVTITDFLISKGLVDRGEVASVLRDGASGFAPEDRIQRAIMETAAEALMMSESAAQRRGRFQVIAKNPVGCD